MTETFLQPVSRITPEALKIQTLESMSSYSDINMPSDSLKGSRQILLLNFKLNSQLALEA